MQEKNKAITINGEHLLNALAEIEYILISLHKIGAFYASKTHEASSEEQAKLINEEYNK